MSFNNECPFCGEVGYDLLGLKSHLQFCDDFQSVPSIRTFYQGNAVAETDAEIVRRERDEARQQLAVLTEEREQMWQVGLKVTAERDALAAALKESLKLSATMLDGGDFDKLDEWEAVARAALSAVPGEGKEMP